MLEWEKNRKQGNIKAKKCVCERDGTLSERKVILQKKKMCLERPWDITQLEKKGPTCLELFGVSTGDSSVRFQIHFNDDRNP